MKREKDRQRLRSNPFNEIRPEDVFIPLADPACDDGSTRFPEATSNAQGLPATISIFSNDPRKRVEIGDDLDGAGFRTRDGGPLDMFVYEQISHLGDMAIVECLKIDGASLAGLIRIDERLEREGGHLIVCTSIDILDDVFPAVSFSDSQILVTPTRSERIVAVGRAMTHLSEDCVREISDEDRLSLLYLARQVEAIAHNMDYGANGSNSSDHAGEHEMSRRNDLQTTQYDGASLDALPHAIVPLPDPKLIRKLIAERQLRRKYFESGLFADPAWDMLLDLTAAYGEKGRVSVSSLCIAAAVPATTALRWLKQMVDTGIFERRPDPSDKRRAFIELSTKSRIAMARYFDAIDKGNGRARLP